MHKPACVRYVDEWGAHWHTAKCESALENFRYALYHSKGDINYAKAIINWLFPSATIVAY